MERCFLLLGCFNVCVEQITDLNLTQLNVRTLVVLNAPTSSNFINYPVYNIRLNDEGVRMFNGPHDFTYSDFITFEESKIYFVFLERNEDVTNALKVMSKIYFWRKRDRVVFILSDCEEISEFKNASNITFLLQNGTHCTTQFKLHNGTIRIALFPHEMDSAPTNNGSYKGRDWLMAKEFLNYIHASGVFQSPQDGITYGTNVKGVLTGALREVAIGNADIAFNSRFTRLEFDNYVEFNAPHDEDDLTLLVPNKHPRTQINFAEAFQGQVWLLIFIFHAIFSVLFWSIQPKTIISWDCLFLKHNNKLLHGVYLCFWLLVTIYYTSRLTSEVTAPKPTKQIDDFEELDSSNLTIYTLARFRDLIVEYEPPVFKNTIKRILIAGEQELMDLIAAHGDYAILCKHRIAEYAILQRDNYVAGRPKYRIMPITPFPTVTCYIVQYGSPLKIPLARFVRAMQSSGIQNFWKALRLQEIFETESKFYTQGDSVRHQIGVHELSMAFYLHGTGCLVATVVFAVECFYYRQ